MRACLAGTVLRARGNEEDYDEQGNLGVEQPAVSGGHQAAVARIDHAVGDDDAGGDHGQHDGEGHDGEALQGLGIGLEQGLAGLEQGMDALDGRILQAGAGRVLVCARAFGTGVAYDQKGRQGAKPDGGQDDVQGVGQDGEHRQLLGRGVAGKRAHAQGQGRCAGAQDVLPSGRAGEADVEGDGGHRQGAGGAPHPDVAHARILHEGKPGGGAPDVFIDARGLGGGGGENSQQACQEDQGQPRQGALHPAYPGRMDAAGNGQEYAAADQDHVGRKLRPAQKRRGNFDHFAAGLLFIVKS